MHKYKHVYIMKDAMSNNIFSQWQPKYLFQIGEAMATKFSVEGV
jgi:hypothetical protein